MTRRFQKSRIFSAAQQGKTVGNAVGNAAANNMSVARPLHRRRARKSLQKYATSARYVHADPVSNQRVPDVQCVVKDLSGGLEPAGLCSLASIGTSIPHLHEFEYVSACFMRNIPYGPVQAVHDVENWPLPFGPSGQLLAFRQGVGVEGALRPCMPKLLVERGAQRVVRAGLRIRLEVFCVDEGTGRGVRTRDAVGPGFFVCEYAGEVLPDAEAEARCLFGPKHEGRDAYLFNLTTPAEWRALGAKPIDVGRGGLVDQQDDEPAFVIDAYHHGNIARFINHACGPSSAANLSPVFVFTEDQPGMPLDARVPRVALFSNRDIAAGEEIRYDYAIQPGTVDDMNGVCRSLPCLCRSEVCRGRIF